MMRLPSSVAILGKGLDLTYEVDGKLMKMSLKGLTISGDIDKRTVWIWASPARASRRTLAQVPRARKLREDWSLLEADEVLEATPRVGKKTTRLGTMRTIGYRSDKWSGKATDYEHSYSSSPVLEQSGDVLRIRGGNQRVTPRGITG